MTQFLLAMTDHPTEADIPTRAPSTDDARTGGMAPRVQVGG
jgi:hypothetical protein